MKDSAVFSQSRPGNWAFVLFYVDSNHPIFFSGLVLHREVVLSLFDRTDVGFTLYLSFPFGRSGGGMSCDVNHKWDNRSSTLRLLSVLCAAVLVVDSLILLFSNLQLVAWISSPLLCG